MRWFYFIAKYLLIGLVPILIRWQVNGGENIPQQGPLLVTSNHIHLVDPPLVALAIRRKAVFMAKEELFRSKIQAYFLQGIGAFPVHRGRMDRKALRDADKVLADGLVLIIFPESTRSSNAKLQQAYSGSALIALRNNVTVLPVAITGTEKVKGPTWWVRRPRITVNIGLPLNLPSVSGKLTKEELSGVTALIMEHIAGLLPSEYRGESYNRIGEMNGIKS
jgi:1-acyl-sn-glycerol-3-phosphate acyltransferase